MSLVLAARLCCRCNSSKAAARLSPQSRALLDRVIRVDHAGEYGAVRIYQGQLAILGRTEVGPLIEEMLGQEEKHLTIMKNLIPEHRVRPTALIPLWNIVGFVLGAGSALLGKEAAMACTVAVETVIAEHYDGQLRDLLADGRDGLKKHKELIEVISKCRDEELEHLDTGVKNDSQKAVFHDALSGAVRIGCRGAIWLSERI